MARSSILGTQHAATYAPGRDADALGPSDSSDSGADIQGQLHVETDDDFETRAAAISGAGNTDPFSDSDAGGTGERGSATPDHIHEAGDISPDRIILSAEEALDSDPDLVAIDDPEAVDIDNATADEDYADSEEGQADPDA